MVYFAQYGEAWTLRGYQLVDRTTGQYKTTPTLANGDFKLEKDGAAAADLATLPVVEPAGGSSLALAFSAEEMQCQQAVVRMVDALGAEWNDDCIHIFTVGDTLAHWQSDPFAATVGVSAASQSAIVASVWGALRADHTVVGSFGESTGSDALVDAILDELIGDGTLTMREALRVCVAALVGKLSGADTNLIKMRNVADTKDVVSGATDAFGNRDAITLDP